jgi:hypothetical protein
MPLNLRRIATALNAYPWTRYQLTNRDTTAPAYCAVGALLRDARIPQDRIAEVSDVDVAAVYGPILGSEYGISGDDTPWRIMAENDSARSRSEAIRRVLCMLSGVVHPHRAGWSEHGTELPPAA